ncbi:Pentatricopeptide repeat-containing protein, mitochondrial [Datura stramonium]|uniref:Pentatricopeptide repeat-containing protein, mitochondrial n=1 Tax=Datura stramonium TaxID=4076 RepID=A0ABS8UIU5_DATST|nr:Pentatricopeptide repeat-containing protein, mitochondrial [Datura stramonium]
MVGERNHPSIAEVYSRLDELLVGMEKLGYKGLTEHDLHDVEVSRKHELLRHHSEKLAFTFGFMCLPSSAPIRIMKNLRICGDCHSFMKFAFKSMEEIFNWDDDPAVLHRRVSGGKSVSPKESYLGT